MSTESNQQERNIGPGKGPVLFRCVVKTDDVVPVVLPNIYVQVRDRADGKFFGGRMTDPEGVVEVRCLKNLLQLEKKLEAKGTPGIDVFFTDCNTVPQTQGGLKGEGLDPVRYMYNDGASLASVSREIRYLTPVGRLAEYPDPPPVLSNWIANDFDGVAVVTGEANAGKSTALAYAATNFRSMRKSKCTGMFFHSFEREASPAVFMNNFFLWLQHNVLKRGISRHAADRLTIGRLLAISPPVLLILDSIDDASQNGVNSNWYELLTQGLDALIHDPDVKHHSLICSARVLPARWSRENPRLTQIPLHRRNSTAQ